MLHNTQQTTLGSRTFKCSDGWLWWFGRHHCKGNRAITGELLSTDASTVDPFIAKLHELMGKDGLYEFQVYNVDETGLFWHVLPRNIYPDLQGNFQHSWAQSDEGADGHYKGLHTMRRKIFKLQDAKHPPLMQYTALIQSTSSASILFVRIHLQAKAAPGEQHLPSLKQSTEYLATIPIITPEVPEFIFYDQVSMQHTKIQVSSLKCNYYLQYTY